MSPQIISLAGGKEIDLVNFDPSSISIYDVARSLSRLCRFNGHCTEFYTVAQHSVLCSHLVPTEFAMQGLLHDMQEALLGDIVRPLKALLPDYQELEFKIEREMRRHFKLPQHLDHSVWIADKVALLTEIRDLMPHMTTPDFPGLNAATGKIVPLNPSQARFQFMSRFYALMELPHEACN